MDDSSSEYTFSGSEEDVINVFDQDGNIVNTEVNCKKKVDAATAKKGPRGKNDFYF